MSSGFPKTPKLAQVFWNCGDNMQNMLLATPILSDAATITGNIGAGALGISNLQKMSVKNPYRVIGDTIALTVDLGASVPFNLVALIAHNMSAIASVRIRASNTNNPATAPYDTGLLPARSDQTGFVASGYALAKNLFFNFSATQTYRYVFLDILDTGAAYIDIGRLYVSKAFQPTTNMDYGLAHATNDLSRKARTVSGEVIPKEQTKWRSAEFTLGFLSKNEMKGQIAVIEQLRGRTKDVLFIPDPDEKDFLQYDAIYGNMESMQPRVAFQYSLFTKAFRIEEIPA